MAELKKVNFIVQLANVSENIGNIRIQSRITDKEVESIYDSIYELENERDSSELQSALKSSDYEEISSAFERLGEINAEVEELEYHLEVEEECQEDLYYAFEEYQEKRKKILKKLKKIDSREIKANFKQAKKQKQKKKKKEKK